MGEIVSFIDQPAMTHLSVQEYLRFDNETPGKHEFYRGIVTAMAGGSANHSGIAFNVSVAIGKPLGGTNCRGFTSDLRVGIKGVASFCYPDLSVVCGPLQYDPRDPGNATVTHPRLIVEVLSPSTESIDRG